MALANETSVICSRCQCFNFDETDIMCPQCQNEMYNLLIEKICKSIELYGHKDGTIATKMAIKIVRSFRE